MHFKITCSDTKLRTKTSRVKGNRNGKDSPFQHGVKFGQIFLNGHQQAVATCPDQATMQLYGTKTQHHLSLKISFSKSSWFLYSSLHKD
jgi:hypothetical protein